MSMQSLKKMCQKELKLEHRNEALTDRRTDTQSSEGINNTPPLFVWRGITFCVAGYKKWLISQICYFVKKTFLESNFFMQMFNVTISCRQSIELFRHKLWYKLNSPHMHYLYTCHTKLLSCSHFGTSCSTSWNSPTYALSIHMLDKQHFAKKYFFFAWHLFMHMLNISVLYMQSIRKSQ